MASRPQRPPRADGLVPTTQVAAVLMVSGERIRQLQNDGYIPRSPVRGHVSLVGAVQGYIRFLKDESRASSRVASESRVRDARAREMELRIAEREGRLVDMADVIAFETDVLGSLAAQLSTLSSRVTRDLAIREKIDKELDDILAACQRRFEEEGRALLAGGESAGPAEEAAA